MTLPACVVVASRLVSYGLSLEFLFKHFISPRDSRGTAETTRPPFSPLWKTNFHFDVGLPVNYIVFTRIPFCHHSLWRKHLYKLRSLTKCHNVKKDAFLMWHTWGKGDGRNSDKILLGKLHKGGSLGGVVVDWFFAYLTTLYQLQRLYNIENWAVP
jgi:hypothetical protein